MNTILIIAAIFGFVLTSLLVFKKTAHRTASFFLGSFYFILSVYALQTYIVDTGQLLAFPWFFIWPLLLYHLIMVPVYFYFVTVIKDQFRWKNSYILLFMPFIVGLIDVIYVYASSSNVYDHILNSTYADAEHRLDANYLLLSLNQHYLLRHLWQLLSLLVILPDLLSFFKEDRADKLKRSLNKWLLFF